MLLFPPAEMTMVVLAAPLHCLCLAATFTIHYQSDEGSSIFGTKLTSVPEVEEWAHFQALFPAAAVLTVVESSQGGPGEDVQGGIRSWGLSLGI